MPKEFLLSTNNFNKPTVLEGNDAVSVLLVRLILLEPGTNPNRPEMGVGLVSRYRYLDEDGISTLKSDIHDQIIQFMPNYQTVEVNVTFEKVGIDDKHIKIDITLDDVLYSFSTEENPDSSIGLSKFIK